MSKRAKPEAPTGRKVIDCLIARGGEAEVAGGCLGGKYLWVLEECVQDGDIEITEYGTLKVIIEE